MSIDLLIMNIINIEILNANLFFLYHCHLFETKFFFFLNVLILVPFVSCRTRKKQPVKFKNDSVGQRHVSRYLRVVPLFTFEKVIQVFVCFYLSGSVLPSWGSSSVCEL